MKNEFSFAEYIIQLIDDVFVDILINKQLVECYRMKGDRKSNVVTLVEYENRSKKLII